MHAAKVGFEKYFLHKVRSGAGGPGYERLIMKMLASSCGPSVPMSPRPRRLPEKE